MFDDDVDVVAFPRRAVVAELLDDDVLERGLRDRRGHGVREILEHDDDTRAAVDELVREASET